MCPLESANTDSVCASVSRSSSVSRTAHGSTGKAGWWITTCVQQLGEVADDDVGAVLAQRVGLADAIDADDEAEVAGPPGLDAGQRVLEHGRLPRLDAERPRAGEERVRRRLALQMLALGDDAVDDLRRTGRRSRPRASTS